MPRLEESLLAKYEGAMLGLAIGDALGFPVEFLSLKSIRSRFGSEGITDLHPFARYPAGTFTDDTQMSLALARAILKKGNAAEHEFLTEVAREFVTWSRSPENTRAPGNTCMAACSELAADCSWRAPGNNNSKGCGTAMRSAPIGLAWHGDDDRIIRLASRTSELTHGHPCATAGSVAMALLTSWALDGMEPRDMYDRLVVATAPISRTFAAKLRQVPNVLDDAPASAYEELGDAWIAEEAVACALYAFWRTPSDYRQTVIAAANMDGDSDSAACIAGAISGAYNGITAIPEAWTQAVEDSTGLLTVAHALLGFRH
ncbi:MAG: ADP-ribosylglycohydrolase family protein [Phycisphaerales bacterium]|nr:ADP-ribosylglycohydrolase family protein [Phycisphaerales bacterium]